MSAVRRGSVESGGGINPASAVVLHSTETNEPAIEASEIGKLRKAPLETTTSVDRLMRRACLVSYPGACTSTVGFLLTVRCEVYCRDLYR